MSDTPKNIGCTAGGFTQLSVAHDATSNAPYLGFETEAVFVDIGDNDVFVTFHGTGDPSATNGHVLYQGKDYIFYAGLFKTAQFRSVAGTAKVNITQLNGYV
tara:strand:+ start:208 stop:513 length:306 start_codon:yes stop_codon:yes gene_type:complete